MKSKVGEGIFMAMGGVDPKLLKKVEQMEKTPVKKERKQGNIWVAVACCALLFGAGSETVRHFVTGSSYRWNDAGQAQFSTKDISKKVYEERESGFFYLFEGANLDATSFCSHENYILDVQIDANGTGYVVAVGGAPQERGYFLFYYENGTFYLGEGLAEPYEVVEMTDPSLYQGEIDSAYPHLVWNHHATHFLGYELSEVFFEGNLPDYIDLELGTAKKIGDSLYFVEGNDFAVYTEWEMGEYVRFSIDDRIGGQSGMGWTYSAEENLFFVELYSPWSAELEEIAVEILEEFGYPYELVFVD